MSNSVQYAKSLLVWALLAPGHEFMVLIIKSILENEGRDNRRAYPLARVQAYQPFDGREDSILFGELSVHISAMRNRANQPKVEDEDKQEALFDRPADAREYELEFPNGKHFPVLMLSYVGPQHERLFYASMHGRRLVVTQSKLYSFEDRSTAPVEFFTCMLLSCPL